MGIQKTVMELFIEAFKGPRTPRSQPYKRGVAAALAFRIKGEKIHCRYPVGTPEADAFFAGVDEGHAIWRKETDSH